MKARSLFSVASEKSVNASPGRIRVWSLILYVMQRFSSINSASIACLVRGRPESRYVLCRALGPGSGGVGVAVMLVVH